MGSRSLQVGGSGESAAQTKTRARKSKSAEKPRELLYRHITFRRGQVLTSRTQAELAVVTADIPAGLAGVRRPGRPPRRPMSHAARWGASGVITPAR